MYYIFNFKRLSVKISRDINVFLFYLSCVSQLLVFSLCTPHIGAYFDLWGSTAFVFMFGKNSRIKEKIGGLYSLMGFYPNK